MKKRTDKTLAILSFALVSLFILIIWYFNKGAHGGADNYTHYRISQLAPKVPAKFLDLWGKPVFTLLNTTFAYFGFKYAQLMNVILGLLSAFFAYRIVRMTNTDNAFSNLLFYFVVFTPIFFILIPSVLTEIVFAFLLLIGIYLFFRNKYLFAAIVLSFLPYARTEGIVLIPIFILAFVLKRKFTAGSFVLFATILFSLIGGFVFNDFLWLIHRFPYQGAKDVYGSGELLHFINNYRLIFGLPLTVFLIIGLISKTIRLIKNFELNSQLAFEYLLIVIPFIIYFSAHSFAWYWGRGGSLGLIRVIAGVAPLAAIIAFWGIQEIFNKIPRKRIKFAISLLLVGWMVLELFLNYTIPRKWGNTEKIALNAAQWLNKSEFSNHDTYFFIAHFYDFIEKEPGQKVSRMYCNYSDSMHCLRQGDILIWDALIGANEGKFEKWKILNNQNLSLLKIFIPEHPIKLYDGSNYEIMIFKKDSITQNKNNHEYLISLLKSEENPDKILLKKTEYLNDSTDKKNENKPFSNMYSDNIIVKKNEIKPNDLHLRLATNIEINNKGLSIDDDKLYLVTEIIKDNHTIRYCSADLKSSVIIPQTNFLLFSIHTELNLKNTDFDFIKVYLWNPVKKRIFIQNLEFKLIELP